MRSTLCIAVLLLSAGAASASGGLSCSGDDTAAKFELMAGVTRGMGGPVFNFRGELEILDPAVAEDMRRLSVEDSHLAQYWFDSEELRLLVFREREADKMYGSVELTIRTKARAGDDGEGTYDGSYELELFDSGDGTSGEKTLKHSGVVSCFTE